MLRKKLYKKIKGAISAITPRQTKIELAAINTSSSIATNSSLLPDQSKVSSLATYYYIYKNEAPVRGAVQVITNAVTSTGWILETAAEGDVEKKDPRVQEVTLWLSNPLNEFYSVIRDITLNLLVHDNAFVELTAHVGKISHGWMYPLDTRFIEPSYDDGKYINKIVHRTSRSNVDTTLVRKRDDTNTGQPLFLHAALNKMGSLGGMSPLESLVPNVNLYDSSKNYNQNLFDGNGQPNIAYVLKQGGRDDYKLLVDKVKTVKKGQDVVVKGDIEIVKLGGQVSDVGYKELVEQVYQDIMTVFQVPPVMMSKPGASTLESSREETSSFSMNVQAFQRGVDNIIDRAIITIWGDGYQDLRFKLKPWVNDKAQCLIDVEKNKIGATFPNEIRARDGLEPVPWGNVPFVVNSQWIMQVDPSESTVDSLELLEQPEQQQQGKPPGDGESATGRPGELERPGNVKQLELMDRMVTIIEKYQQADQYSQEFYSKWFKTDESSISEED